MVVVEALDERRTERRVVGLFPGLEPKVLQ